MWPCLAGTHRGVHEDLKAAKEEDIKAGQDQIDTKTQDLASTDEKFAESE